MKKHIFDDCSFSYEYEIGDLVRIIKNDSVKLTFKSHKVGDWGKVTGIEKTKHWQIAQLTVQLAGYCYDEDAFFQRAFLFPWQVEPKNEPKNIEIIEEL